MYTLGFLQLTGVIYLCIPSRVAMGTWDESILATVTLRLSSSWQGRLSAGIVCLHVEHIISPGTVVPFVIMGACRDFFGECSG